MNEKRLSNINSFIAGLGKNYKPNGGAAKAKGIWDPNRKQYNQSFFSDYLYLAFLVELNGDYYYQLPLEDKYTTDCYIKYFTGREHSLVILDTGNGKVYARKINLLL